MYPNTETLVQEKEREPGVMLEKIVSVAPKLTYNIQSPAIHFGLGSGRTIKETKK